MENQESFYVTALLTTTLDEKHNTDELLSKIATNIINVEAAELAA